MDRYDISLMAGFLLGSLSVWLANYLNDRYACQEKKPALLLLKRSKREINKQFVEQAISFRGLALTGAADLKEKERWSPASR
jgi:hypothetical protein